MTPNFAADCTAHAIKLEAAALTATGWTVGVRDHAGKISACAHEVIPGGFNMMGVHADTVAVLTKGDAALYARQYNATAHYYRAEVVALAEAYTDLAAQARMVADMTKGMTM